MDLKDRSVHDSWFVCLVSVTPCSQNHLEDRLPDLRLLKRRADPLLVVELTVDRELVHVGVLHQVNVELELVHRQQYVELGPDGETDQIRVGLQDMHGLEGYLDGDGASETLSHWATFYTWRLTRGHGCLPLVLINSGLMMPSSANDLLLFSGSRMVASKPI
jgi:hypothetical protein